MGPEIYHIDPELCTECKGHFTKPQCQIVCPVDCIPLDELYEETEGQLASKFEKLTGEVYAVATKESAEG